MVAMMQQQLVLVLAALALVGVAATGPAPSLEPAVTTPAAPSTFLGLPTALIAGGAGGIVSRTATAPLDRLKVVLQTDRTPLSSRASLGQTLARLYQDGGFRGLFRGNFANVIKVCPENAIKMWVFDRLGGFRPAESRSVAEQFAIGATAGAVSQAITYPLETIKTRFAVSRTGQFQSLASCAAGVYDQAGLRGFYRGLSAATSGMIPFAGVDLTLLALMHGAWRRHRPHEDPSPIHLLLFGAVSSSCGQLVAYPLQLIRTRLQSQGMPQNPVVYDDVVDCFVRIVRSDGYGGLYRGLKPNFMKALPSMSISYMVYDVVNRQLQEMERVGLASIQSAASASSTALE